MFLDESHGSIKQNAWSLWGEQEFLNAFQSVRNEKMDSKEDQAGEEDLKGSKESS